MRIYAAYLDPASLERDRGVTMVKEGMCWPAFFFSFLWAAWHGIWWAALALPAAALGIAAILTAAGAGGMTGLLCALAAATFVGGAAERLARPRAGAPRLAAGRGRRGAQRGGRGPAVPRARFRGPFRKAPFLPGTGGRVTVAIVDYGSGNLRSAAKAFERAASGAPGRPRVAVTADPAELARADRIVLPGVGAFVDCMTGLARLPGMVEALPNGVRAGVPLLGICVGMQLMATVGEEHGIHDGLGWVPGRVVPLPPGDGLRIPHMDGTRSRPARTIRCSPGWRRGRTPISSIPTRWCPTSPATCSR